MGADGAVADARHILRWIERHEKTEFSERDAYRTMTTRFKHPADLHPGLTALENRGYLRRVPEPKGKGPGRKPSPRWEVNPALRSRN
jgi:putative DNA primase/helicase